MAYATKDDVQTRLGRDLTTAEEARATASLNAIAGLIQDACGKSSSWEPDPVPTLFKTLSIEKAIGVIVNPTNLAAESKQLGAYQRSQTFQRAMDVGVFLTDAEERRVRRAAFGRTSGSVVPDSILDDIWCLES